mgnify:CR=1 FL=1
MVSVVFHIADNHAQFPVLIRRNGIHPLKLEVKGLFENFVQVGGQIFFNLLPLIFA